MVCDMIEGERCVLEVSGLPIKGLHVESLKKTYMTVDCVLEVFGSVW